MTFAADRRGRVPFAFLGAILLLSSSVYAVSLAPAPATSPAADEVVQDAQIETRLALESAIRTADRRAAAEPVLEPSEAGMGSILPAENTFTRALELRIAAGARQSLAHANASRASLDATTSLPPIRGRDSARRALENVTIRPVGEDRYRVRVEGIRVTLERHDRPVDRFRYNATVTTVLPALELHERTNEYESHLNADVTDPGLARDLTARLFPIVWMRGYAQYGGAPLQNVLANRHVEVMTNDALLAQQAAVFGVEDPAGRTATGVAAADVAARDLFLGAEEIVKSHLSKPNEEVEGAGEPENSPSVPMPSVVDTEQEVDANHAADEAFLAFHEGRSGRSLEGTVDDVYRASVRVESRATTRGTEHEHYGEPPENATKFHSRPRTERWLAGGGWSDGSGSTLRRYTGTVIEETTTIHYWIGNGTFGTTTSIDRTTHRVRLDLTCRYRAPGLAPDRPDGRCPFGPVARDRVAARGTHRLLSGSALENRAIAAASGGGGTGWRTVDVEPPAAAIARASRRTKSLHRAVRDVSVSVETRSVASSTNPAAELAAKIEQRRAGLLDTPARYDSVEDRAVAAARVAYIERVGERLDSRTPMVQRAQNAFADQLASNAIPSGRPERSTPTADSYVATVSGGPAYLSVDPPGGSAPPLAARNVNLFTLPYGDAADAVADRIGAGGDTSVSLRAAAQTLAALESAGSARARTLRDLRNGVSDGVDRATAQYESVLVGPLDRRTARRVVESAVAEYDSVSARGLAVANGQLAADIAERVPGSLPSVERDRIGVALRVAGTEAQADASVRVSQSVVERARTEATSGAPGLVTESAKAGATEAGKRLWKEATDTKVGTLPAGLPLVPVPGYWYATANAWTVSVRGTYDRFAVRAHRVPPGRIENGTIEYVREDRTIRADLDGDGTTERLGANRPLSFEAHTGVVIVVPPGKTGVGDVDGQAIETSPGW